MANAIRALAMDAVQTANSGHPGMPMGMADVATVLFSRFLKFQAERPDWPDRDRFVLSAGHGSMLLYALLHLTGYPEMTLEEIKNFRQVGARTAGHPEYGLAPGIETTTGPLGQGLANAVGMALAERLLNARFGDDVVDHRTYVVASDGDLMEGISHEAAALAGHLRLGRLIVFFDDNGISIDGPTSLSDSVDHGLRFQSYGWHVQTIDGHDPEAIARATEQALADDRPSLIACRTTIGFGAPSKAGKASSHGAPLGEDEIAGARAALGWSHPPFKVPSPILETWRAAGKRGAAEAEAWDRRLAALEPAQAQAFEAAVKGELAAGWQADLAGFKKAVAAEAPKVATRVSSQKVLEVLVEKLPQLIGGSADLTGSNGTRTGAHKVVSAEDFSGNYLHYGIREHGMAAVMNGVALHGGLIPYGGSFLVFTDYCRPSIRLSALMEQRVVYVMTHDSIGLGEDGPTHQPVEHLAALRAIPNLRVFRPCDSIETAEAWELALSAPDKPSVLALSRQGLPTLRTETFAENYSAWGAYILAPAAEQRQVTLIASGSEVEVALEARKLLAEENIYAAVVSMPCWELFLEQPAHYRDEVLGPGLLRVAIEAAGWFGWHRWVGLDGTVVGMEGFGASGPAPELYQHFQITPKAVVERVKSWL
ncbi:MAG: transketolase [Kiloniellales bacterium]|nr:transketolase [Kiloniellales bacterium]